MGHRFKRGLRLALLIGVFMMASGGAAGGSDAGVAERLREAEENFTAGRLEAAFRLYVGIRGAEYLAAAVGRHNPPYFLEVLRGIEDLDETCGFLLEGELHLAAGDHDMALARFRLVADGLRSDPDVVPDYYVDPVVSEAIDAVRSGPSNDQGRRIGIPTFRFFARAPFTVGPGSHRDNWLLARFIALGAWEDAVTEFERIWQVYRVGMRPHVVDTGLRAGEDGSVATLHLIHPEGPGLMTLQFVLDYVYFLERAGRGDDALDLLLETLLELRMPALGGPSMQRVRGDLPEVEGLPMLPTTALSQHGRDQRVPDGTDAAGFVALAYAELKRAGRLAALETAITWGIEGGGNHLRLLQSEIHELEGREELKLALELEFIDHLEPVDPVERHVRRARAFDRHAMTMQAIEEHEAVTSLLEQRWQEQDDGVGAEAVSPHVRSREKETLFRSLGALETLYRAAGEERAALAAAERRSEIYQPRGKQLWQRMTARAAEQGIPEEEVRDWLRQNTREGHQPMVLAELFWLAEDPGATAEALAEDARLRSRPGSLDNQWRQAFVGLGKDEYRGLLTKLVEVNPGDFVARLELLQMLEEPPEDEVIEALEQWLDHGHWHMLDTLGRIEVPWSVQRLIGFASCYELAYVLARRYEQAGRMEDVKRLGLRLALREKPFDGTFRRGTGAVEDLSDFDYANALLALVLHHADDAEYLAGLAKALEESPWSSAAAQLRRRLDPPRDDPEPPVPWTAEAGDAVIVTSLTVCTAMAHDDEHVYAGHPWGLTVHTHDGEPVASVPLWGAVNDLLAFDGSVWIASSLGLLQMEIGTWEIKRLAERDQVEARGLGMPRYVACVATDGEGIWFASGQGLGHIDPETMEVRFHNDPLLIKPEWTALVAGADFVWVSGRTGMVRLNRTDGRCDQVVHEGSPVVFTGISADRLWGSVVTGVHRKHLPCVIDPVTLRVTVLEPRFLPFLSQIVYGDRPVVPVGRDGAGRKTFVSANGVGWLGFEPETMTMERLPGPPADLSRWQTARGWSTPTYNLRSQWRTVVRLDEVEPRDPSPGEVGADPGMFPLILPGGKAVLPQEDGLLFVRPDGSGRLENPGLPDGFANDVSHDPVRQRYWVASRRGVTLFDEDFRRLRHFSSEDGLLSDDIGLVAVSDDHVYLARGGRGVRPGLMVYSHEAGVFRSFGPVDGLTRAPIVGLEVRGDRLEITYGEVEVRGQSNMFQPHATGIFDPATRRFSGGEPLPAIPRSEVPRREPAPGVARAMPLIGGPVVRQVVRDTRSWWMGSHGLVADPPDSGPELPEVAWSAWVRREREEIQGALARPASFDTPEDLVAALEDEDPFFRVRAMISPAALEHRLAIMPTMIRHLGHPHVRVRATAMAWVAALEAGEESEELVELLRERLGDSVTGVRRGAVVQLLRFGHRPEAEVIREFVDPAVGLANLPIGLGRPDGRLDAPEDFWPALVAGLDSGLLDLILRHPPEGGPDSSVWEDVIPVLGRFVAANPDAICAMLRLEGDPDNLEKSRFVAEILGAAGPEILPQLHEALGSDDPVTRANAARACGVIGDANSVAALLDALDPRCGVSRDAIVAALGRIGSGEALPMLRRLYASAGEGGPGPEEHEEAGDQGVDDECPVESAKAMLASEYERLREVVLVEYEWADILPGAAPSEGAISADVPLSAETVLSAVRNLPREETLGWYRELTSDPLPVVRIEAAAALADGAEADREDDIIRLWVLMDTDPNPSVQRAAAVSLLILGGPDAQEFIVRHLRSNSNAMRRELLRVKDPEKLEFLGERAIR